MNTFLETFMLVFGSLFPIVNPLGSSLLFLALTRTVDRRLRAYLALRIGLYGFFIIVLSLLGGSWFLTFFGVSVPALRVGGGFVLAVVGWRLLDSKDRPDESGVEPPDEETLKKSAFYPLTMPLTTGPGTIAATIALGTSPSVGPFVSWAAALGALAAAAAIAGMIAFFFRFADRVESVLGRTLTDAMMRLFALFLLCIGVEILWAGIAELIQSAHFATTTTA
jgi:multiple antibiotic resistance protein